jgi:hypothetical protein
MRAHKWLLRFFRLPFCGIVTSDVSACAIPHGTPKDWVSISNLQPNFSMRTSLLVIGAALAIPSLGGAQRPAPGGQPLPLPVAVTWTTAGSAFDWTLDFTVTNNIPVADENIDLFGLLIGAPQASAAGAPYDYQLIGFPWDNRPYGGAFVYDIAWRGGFILSGASLDGFLVHLTTQGTPQVMNWTIWASSPSLTPYSNPYTFYNGHNGSEPAFEGVTFDSVVPTPEPATAVLVGSGILSIVMLRWRRRRGPMAT